MNYGILKFIIAVSSLVAAGDMAGEVGGGVGMVFGGSNMNAFVQNSSSSSQPLDAFFIPGSSSSFMGSSSMVSFEGVPGGKRSQRAFFHTLDQDDNGDEDYDEYFHQPEKKRRLTVEQVRFLEKSFEVENKLEPERKVQLAKDLGLQPRQVAIWFQNRRARWKTKQLEKDYDTLQSSYNTLKTDYDALLKEKDKLKAEIHRLSVKLQLEEKVQLDVGGPSDTSTRVPPTPPRQEPIVDSASEEEVPQLPISAYNPEDLCSVKSDAFDSDSPRYDGVHSVLRDYGDSSYVFETDQSELSQDEEDNLNMGLLPSSYDFPKIEDVNFPRPPVSSCNFGLPLEDHASWIWSSY